MTLPASDDDEECDVFMSSFCTVDNPAGKKPSALASAYNRLNSHEGGDNGFYLDNF